MKVSKPIPEGRDAAIAGFKTAMKLLDNMALLRGREATVWQA